jgi:hypothetical protein
VTFVSFFGVGNWRWWKVETQVPVGTRTSIEYSYAVYLRYLIASINVVDLRLRTRFKHEKSLARRLA